MDALVPAKKFAFHCAEGEDRLAESECEPWPYFENGKVIFHHLSQRPRRLIVGGMGFVHDQEIFSKRRIKATRLFAIIGKHHIIAELDAGLDDQGNDSLPSGSYSALGKCGSKTLQSVLDVSARGDCGRSACGGLTSWRGNFGPDHVHGGHGTYRQFLKCRFSSFSQDRGTFGDNVRV